MSNSKAFLAGLIATVLAGCGGGSGSPAPGTPPPTTTPPPTASCAAPTPAQAIDQSITVDIPSDSDTAATNPPQTITPTSTIYFTMLLPARCPGDAFPVILQSHGYGGTRLKTLAANGDLAQATTDPHFPSINELVQALPYHGYAVISYDERGHGDSYAANARIIDPAAEVQDARRILDWAYDNAATYNFQTEPATGVAKDLKVGTIGYSYGGGFEMPLAALDDRIDTIVPNGTWNDLLYSLLPGDAVKLSFDGLLCLLATTASTSAQPNTGVHNTPLVASLCNAVGIQNPLASTNRTRSDLTTALALPTALPRPVAASEVDPFFYTHSARYFETQEAAGQPWGFGEAVAKLRKVPALFLQGNRDTLFNLTEAYWNASYFASTGADVRILSTEGGHMNPLANQVEGPANCGKVIGVTSILAWFDQKLKGIGSADYDAIPKICISVADTVAGQPGGTPAGLKLDRFPVGSLSGTGAVPVRAETLSGTVDFTATGPAFVPVATISGSGQVLAGAPRIDSLSVAPGTGAVQTAIAFVGVGIRRGGQLILVDDEVTPFVEGTHTSNRGVNNAKVLLPAVGEMLQDGDEVGLLLYPQQVQYAAVVSAASLPNATNVVSSVLGQPIPPIASAIDSAFIAPPNPYVFNAAGVELPILVPGQYPGSSLSQ